MEELRECPKGHNAAAHDVYLNRFTGKKHFVQCQECGWTGPTCDTKEEAEEAWQGRAIGWVSVGKITELIKWLETDQFHDEYGERQLFNEYSAKVLRSLIGQPLPEPQK